MKQILLTNDDGYHSPGLMALAEKLREDFQVTIVAPLTEQSAVSMSLTLNNPLKIRKISRDTYAINGTPADCVNIALQKILENPPEMVVSGMNMGENLSEDIFFSGTVGGAFAGYLYNLPALATSLISGERSYAGENYDYQGGARITRQVIESLLRFPENRFVFNLNIPYRCSGGIQVTRLGFKRYRPDIIQRRDPRGRNYYWIGTGHPEYRGEKDTDVHAVSRNRASLSLLNYNLNSSKGYQRLKGHMDHEIPRNS